jgi:hypothetical protein
MIREIDIWAVAVLMVKRYAGTPKRMPTGMRMSLRPREIKLVRLSGVGSHLQSSN